MFLIPLLWTLSIAVYVDESCKIYSILLTQTWLEAS